MPTITITANLQSEQSPLRTLNTYYQPLHRPTSNSMRKIFHQQQEGFKLKDIHNLQHNQQSISNQYMVIQIVSYLDSLGKVRGIQRRDIVKRQDIYSFINLRKKPIIITQQPSTDYTFMTKDLSLSTIKCEPIAKTNRASSLCKILDAKRKGSLTNRLKRFEGEMTARDYGKKNQQKRFTFYNNDQKARHIMEKYRMFQHLTQRASNQYQNILNRTIVKDSLVATIDRLDKKRRKGEIV